MTAARASADRISFIGTAATGLTALATIASFCISPMTLTAIGINYDTEGGNPLLKLHPGNWLFAIALLCSLFSKTDPVQYLYGLPRAFPGALLFVVMETFTLVFATTVQHAPAMPLVDTFFAATAMLVLYEDVGERTRPQFRLLVHVILFANASVGIIEFLTQSRLTPFIVAGAPILHDYRSTALFGHPLLNAGTTAGYVLMLFFGGDPSGRPLLKSALIGLQLVALIAFGGRTAIVLLGVLLTIGSLPTIAGVVNGRSFDRRVALILALGLPMILVAVAAAASNGLFTELIDRFVYDKGSTQARVVMFDLFNSFSLEDILLGPNPDRLASLQTTLGIEYGIENSWLGLVFQYGAIIAVFFVFGLFALLGDFVRRTRPKAIFIIAYFLVLASSAAVISVKSFAFNQFAIFLLIAFGRSGEPSDASWRAVVRLKRAAGSPLRA